MAEQNEQHFRPTILPEEMAELLKASAPDDTPVPDLIEQYRLRRIAWLKQADELARTRDELARMRAEVRSSSEREAKEIVTKTQRDVRGLVMDARHNLHVLSAHLHDALGEDLTLPASLQTPETAQRTDTPNAVTTDTLVTSLLQDAQAQLNTFDEEVHPVPADPPAQPVEVPARASSLSPPYAPRLPQPDRVKVASAARMWPVGAALVVTIIAALLLTTFVLEFFPSAVPEAESAVAAVAESQAAKAPVPPPSTPPLQPSALPAASVSDPQAPPAPESVSVRIEARRDVWVRTIVDGRADAGRLLERGARYEVSGEHSVGLRVGDAGAVTVAVNSGEPHVLGRDGEVVSRSFGDGLAEESAASANR